MNISIHVETVETEQPLMYTGEDADAALEFVEDIVHEPTVVQCNLMATVKGERRALARMAKGEKANSLLADVAAWLEEASAQ